MDYKLNMLQDAVEVNEIIYPDISGLFFGDVAPGEPVFDFTRYAEENEMEDADHRVFMRMNKFFIEQILSSVGRKTTRAFYMNKDGHILIAAELVFLCVCFFSPDMTQYFSALVSDVLSDGIAYSSGFIYHMAAKRLPTMALEDILKERQNGPAGDQQ